MNQQSPGGIPELEALFPSLVTFPDPRRARKDGLLAVGGDMLPGTLIRAYARGIFPWTSDPITWWSPDPRAIFDIASFRLSTRGERYLRSGRFEITFDTAFESVMEGCARPAPGREESWISRGFVVSYTRLFRMGFAHSVEARMEGKLVGGVYGVALGGFFAGESMFHTVPNASNVALGALMARLKLRGFTLFDTQVITPHTRRLGAFEIPRIEYLRLLSSALRKPCDFP
ncbi:MAG TPA: leucyl/phenylalanyl-tRNA--protein transferase [Candidatus Ozemobacteraceae bacterium]|nr:leucyl/phenylalanyl-tRNA--protein transferase [Candidatus Ozemobacteraceae bacterium]